MARVVLVLLGVSLTIFALIDCARTDSARIPARIPKYLWLILILILPVIGPLLWILFKNQDLFKSNKPISAGDFLSSRSFSGKKTEGPKAPDDDPDFLARLDAQNRRRAYEERKRRAADEADPTETTEKGDGDTDDTDGDTPRGLYDF